MSVTRSTLPASRRDRAALRQRLAKRLRDVIGNPVIEEKELAAFDIVMSRREVLKLGGSSLMVAGLVAAGVPPTAWGQRDPSLDVHPCEVGLTAEDQASVSVATQLGIGTELFEGSIYADAVVSPQAGPTHAVIEGARHRYRLQSRLDSINPTEAGLMLILFQSLPTSFLPQEDQGVMYVQINAPVGSTQERTLESVYKVEDYFMEQEGEAVESMFGVQGFSFGGGGQNSGLAFVKLKPWEERESDDLHVNAVVGRAFAALS